MLILIASNITGLFGGKNLASNIISELLNIMIFILKDILSMDTNLLINEATNFWKTLMATIC